MSYDDEDPQPIEKIVSNGFEILAETLRDCISELQSTLRNTNSELYEIRKILERLIHQITNYLYHN